MLPPVVLVAQFCFNSSYRFVGPGWYRLVSCFATSPSSPRSITCTQAWSYSSPSQRCASSTVEKTSMSAPLWLRRVWNKRA